MSCFLWTLLHTPMLLPPGFQGSPLSMLSNGVLCHDGHTLYLTYPIW